MRAFPLALGLVLCWSAEVSSAATFTVTTTDDVDDGVCDAHCSLREAVAAANGAADSDTISVPEGLFLLTRGGLRLSHSTRIDGMGSDRTVIDGGGAVRIFEVESGSFMITGVTLRGGYSDSDGGALRILSSAVMNLSGVDLVANRADFEGGAIAASGGLLIADCTLAGNRAGQVGGALALNLGVSAEVVRSTFIANSAIDGSAIWAPRDSSIVIAESLLTANRAARGGAYGANHADATIVNSTFSANSAADSSGGALYLNAGTTVLRNCTLLGNTAPRQSSTIRSSSADAVTLENTIVAGPGSVDDCWIDPTSAGHNLDVNGTCGLSQSSDLSGVAAGLGELRDNGGPTLTHELLRGSAAVDAGGGNVAAADQRGVARPVGAAPDIGAYEADGSEPPVGTPLTVPVVAHLAGVGGTPWRSDLSLTNVSAAPLPVELLYVPNTGLPISSDLTLKRRETVLFEDLVGSTLQLGDGRGALKVTPTPDGSTPAVLSRTMAQMGPERLGQGMPALRPMAPGTYYVVGLREDDLYRSNLGVAAGDQDLVVQVDLFRGNDGAVGSTFAQNLAAGNQAQWRFPVMFPALAQTGIPMTARVRIFAAAAPYGSLVDQTSADAVTLLAQPAGYLWSVPVIAHNTGGAGTFWRSDLFLHNPNPIPARIELEYLPEGLDNSSGGTTVTVTVAPYATVTVADVAGTLFSVTEGKGSLEIVGAPRFVASSRTYTARAVGGTYGLGVPAVPPWEFSASRKVVAGVREGNGYRSNLGLVGGAAGQTVELILDDDAGNRIANASVAVPARSIVQRRLQDLFSIDWGQFKLGSVEVSVSEQPLLVYLSVVDGSSQDPIYAVAPAVP